MRDLAPKEILTSDLLEHAAVKAWSLLQPQRVQPQEVQTLKRNKSAVYRLQGVGPGGSSVIAKRCLTRTALTEVSVYQEILPRLPVPCLQFYGVVEDPDPNFRWLFIEDAGKEPWLPELPAHQNLFAHWLAILHSAGELIDAASVLPDRGPAHFLEHLRQGRENIQHSIGNPALTDLDWRLLEKILKQFDFLESAWDRIKSFCARMPQTFIHGDLKTKNLRVRHCQEGLVLLCFDWETAGWGLIGPDLTKCIALTQYHAVARKRWPTLNGAELERWLNAGTVFRMLAEIQWETTRLQYQSLERPRLNLTVCQERLTQVIEALGMNQL